MRYIAHADMNAFFAAVEQQCNPSLRKKPIAVCGPGNRTVISAASYEAKAYGVRAGMPPAEALRICPGLKLVTGSGRKYVDTSARIFRIFRNFSPLVEAFSIDEAFLDLTSVVSGMEEAARTATQIKKAIYSETALTCSIGISNSKLMAKLGSELKKPDGLMLIPPAAIPSLLANLPVESLCGIGPSTSASLHMLGIKTCGQLGSYPLSLLRRRFGVMGDKLHLMGLGIDLSPVVPAEAQPAAKSFGHSITLPENTADPLLLNSRLLQLSQAVGRRMRADNAAGTHLTLIMRYADFSTLSRRKTLSRPVTQSLDIYRTACDLLHGQGFAAPLRLLGISISGITRSRQLSLLPEEELHRSAQAAMDMINDVYGEGSITWGLLPAKSETPIPPGPHHGQIS